ncbi:MAG TPA: hypothetical protein VGE23_01140 [Candidatus Paceibacterota bacterium]
MNPIDLQWIDPTFHFERRGNIISGAWKFRHLTSHGSCSGFMKLLNFASAWKTAEPDRLLHIAVRYKGQHNADSALDFAYEMEHEGPEHHEAFFRCMEQQLKEVFGENYRGYDLSSPTWLIERPQ